MFRRFAAVILSAILLSPGWLGMTGMTLLIGFVPLLWVSASYDDTRRSWWGMFGWATLAFVLWNALTIWWIWYATPVGPPAATLASTTMNMIAIEQLAQMQQDILRVEQKATAGLTGEELKTLYVLLDKVIENLTPGKEERTID